MIESFKEFLNTEAGSTLAAIFIFGIVSILGFRITQFLVNRVSKRLNPDALHWDIIKQCNGIAWLIAFIIALVESLPHLDGVGTAIVACSSVFVAALGLASQDALGNAIDGVFISIFEPFKIGDRITLRSRGITGIVLDINLRYTSVKTVENNILMIPNSIMNDEIIENSNLNDDRIKAFIDITISYKSSITVARQVITDIVTSNPLFVDIRTDEDKENGVPPVSVIVRNLEPSGVQLRITVCSANIGDSFKLCSEVREGIVTKFKSHNIAIAYQAIKVVTEDNMYGTDIEIEEV